MQSAVQKSLEYLESKRCYVGDFIDRYTQEHRVYHGLDHMEHLLVCMEDMNIMYELGDSDYTNLQLGVWYHDFVYDVGSNKNEESSAIIATDRLGESPVPNMVRITKAHLAPKTFLESCLLDADLSGLGYPWPIYSHNARSVKAEYSAFPNAVWEKGRIAFLEKMLDRSVIFYSSWGGRLERFARRNMERELASLGGRDDT